MKTLSSRMIFHVLGTFRVIRLASSSTESNFIPTSISKITLKPLACILAGGNECKYTTTPARG